MEETTNYTILIVDDIPSNLKVLHDALKNDYTVKTANSGELALKKVYSEKPDLILLDILLPDMSGYDILGELKKSAATQYIPIIFITGLSDIDDETKGLFLGAVDYITKPFNINIVKARVRTHLQIVKQMRIIEEMGMIDPLTGLANRRKFDQASDIEWSRAKRDKNPVSMIMTDLDRFKTYNDTYGHPAGDVLLQKISAVLAKHARRGGDLAARFGGEEFVLFFPEMSLENAVKTGETIRAEIEALAIPSGYDPSRPVTASFGAASMIPDAENSVSGLIKACDEKLYQAKETGRNKVCY